MDDKFLKKMAALFALMLTLISQNQAKAQFHEIKHDTIDAYGWFGGDDRPTQGPRHVGVGQGVLVDAAMTVERFSFYFRGPFDFAAAPAGRGHAVTLALNVRDSSGTILKTVQTALPDTFSADWVMWTESTSTSLPTPRSSSRPT